MKRANSHKHESIDQIPVQQDQNNIPQSLPVLANQKSNNSHKSKEESKRKASKSKDRKVSRSEKQPPKSQNKKQVSKSKEKAKPNIPKNIKPKEEKKKNNRKLPAKDAQADLNIVNGNIIQQNGHIDHIQQDNNINNQIVQMNMIQKQHSQIIDGQDVQISAKKRAPKQNRSKKGKEEEKKAAQADIQDINIINQNNKAIKKQKSNQKQQIEAPKQKRQRQPQIDAVPAIKKSQSVARAPPRKRQRLDDEQEEEKAVPPQMAKGRKINKANQIIQNEDAKMDQIEQDQNRIDQNIEGGENQQPKKRVKKAAAKKAAKPKKVVEPVPLREEVEIPDVIKIFQSQDQEPQINCCQTCSNRNGIRSVLINSVDLFIKCQKSRAHVSSLIEQMGPELRYSALDRAVQLNRLDILEILLDQSKPENEFRMKKKSSQIVKFETGEVGQMAFGYKVRKVQMMRGNRQGNNAFTEDPTHEYQTPLDYLLNDQYCIEKCFGQDGVNRQTLELIQKFSGDRFIPFIQEKALPFILRNGCYKTLVALFGVLGQAGDIQNNFFNDVYYQLLTVDKVENFKITPQQQQLAKQNQTVHYTYIAALNPSGVALRYLNLTKQDIEFDNSKPSAVFYAAVCKNDVNLKILKDLGVNFHGQDDKKCSPLMWALRARVPLQVVETLSEELNSAQFHHKDEQKQMAIHFFCKYGVDMTLGKKERFDRIQDFMQFFVEWKAKFSQFGGWNKFTPLIYACTYGNIDIAEYLIKNIPRLSINKGDKYKRTPLAMSCRNGHANIAALLIKHNCDINLADTSENSPLHYAAAYGWIECVEVLIKYGADPSPDNAWKSTPITIALQKNHIAIVKELLKTSDIDVNSKDDEGRTLLTLAMANINFESIEFINHLINSKGSDVNQQDAKGRTPLYIIVESLSSRKQGLFSDHDALEYKIVKMLISQGASLNLKTKDGKSPFSLAFEKGMNELLDLFGKEIDLNKDPFLLFAFSGISCMKISLQGLLKSCFDRTRIEDETINFVNDQGFTPLLYYLHQFVQSRDQILTTIQDMIAKHEKFIDNQNIIEKIEQNQQAANLFINPTQKSLDIYESQIIQPFLKFLQVLIDNGANPNAYILKLKQYRDEPLQQTQLSQISQQVAAQGRRPPEKDQYTSELLGLCSVIHLLVENNVVIRPVFDFFINLQGIQLNQVNFQKMTPFFKLVKTKNIKDNQDHKYCFEQLIKTGKVDIDAPDQFGMSSFWFFYSNNRFDEAFYLVSQGANINHIDNYGFFALKKELFNSNINMIQKLLEKKANPDTTDEFQRTILHLSCDFSHRKDYKEIFKLLIKHNANIQALDFKARTPIHYMFVKKNRRDAVDQFDPLNLNIGLDILINKDTIKDIDFNHQDINGKSLLHYMAQRGSTASLKHFIKLLGVDKINFNIEDKYKNTPLSIAINSRHFDFVEYLIQLQLVNLKGFIYDQPKQQRVGNLNDDEQSDLEFMQVVDQNGIQILNGQKAKHDKDALNLFRYIIRNQVQQLEKLFIENQYDRIQMVVDYICEGQIAKLFQVIETHFKNVAGAKGSILIQKNEKGQNLIHVLAKNAHLIKNISELTKFYQMLVKEGVDPKELDNKGRSALHLAVKSGNIHLIQFLVDVELFDVNQIDNQGTNSINQLLKGDRIVTANKSILIYLIKKGGDSNNIYNERLYQPLIKEEDGIFEELKQDLLEETYKTTSVIHAIRHESKNRDNIRVILKKLLKHANPSIQDSDGKDAFFYTAIRNHYNTFNFIVNYIYEKKQSYDSIVKDNIDKNGKSFIHFIINPLEFGSFENSDILQKALEIGFKHNIRDKQGMTPYQQACLQKSGVLIQVFKENNLADEDLADEMIIDTNRRNDDAEEQMNIDFESDAQSYLQQIQMQIDSTKFVPCDPSGKFNDDCIVMYDQETEQHFDVYMTRVEIGKFQPGGDYLFYKMQLVLDQSRDLAILLTRWGRIGEEGAFQKTPFSTHEEAIDEFKKVFEQKSGNKWCKADNFHKKFRKFQLMRTNYVTIDQKNYLLPFDLENSAPINNQFIHKNSVDMLREICDVNTYLKALQNSGVDPKAMPFSNLDRQNLYDALEVLKKLQGTLKKLEQMNPRPYAENEKMKLLQTREKMWYLSSRFYEYIPHEEYRNKMVPPISTMDMLIQKSSMIQNLIEIEAASKMLLGAHFKQDQINPLEYCLRASGIRFEYLDIQKDQGEYKLIHQYGTNTYLEQNKKQIKSIIRLTKYDEQKKFRSDLENRKLLFHGSRVSNFLGIMKHGLRVQPIEVQRNGNLLGKGIYFTDMISKAIQYTNDQNAPQHGSKFILVCEVSLGEQKQVKRFNQNFVFEEGINSIQGQGRQAPDEKILVTLPDGAQVPLGKAIPIQGNENSDFQFNEYVVPEVDQVRMRYLIQLK
ncbi:nad(+) adp-ribosyltransferase-3 [Stylonychia lemnae]|uniref:Poly [ADP-ribose] polymerase n=1 Tax=Stylonychia lemnae TaxID=5949 RepID=A0A078A9R4_STYLE|nr:nad(+) adp-ribosyltransferase-3 [Stylonychia lemnae]|eukprot:CDW79015.1 nad(+) adp-ribosyltransferase-3 [Stylonychia lemnae]